MACPKTNAVLKQGFLLHYVPNANFGKWREQFFVLHEGGRLSWYQNEKSFELGAMEGFIPMAQVSNFIAVGSYTQRAPLGPPPPGPPERIMAIASMPSPRAPVLWLYFHSRVLLLEWMQALYQAVQPYGQGNVRVDPLRVDNHKGFHSSAAPPSRSTMDEEASPLVSEFRVSQLRTLMTTGLGLGHGWGLPHQNCIPISPLKDHTLRSIFGAPKKPQS